MNREEQLKFCKVCENQKFDLKQGIICGLTDQIADFEETCYDFVENSFLREEWEASKKEADVESRMASAGKRFGNLILDGIFLNVINYVLGLVLSQAYPPPVTTDFNEILNYFLVILFFNMMIYFAYYVGLEITLGKTIGKMITNTRVVNMDGQQPSVGAIIGRTFARLIPFEPFSFLGRDASGWHDKLTKTRVIDNY